MHRAVPNQREWGHSLSTSAVTGANGYALTYLTASATAGPRHRHSHALVR